MSEGLTDEQLRRQDWVDNAIQEMLEKINPTSREIPHDIEMLGAIRDIVEQWFIWYGFITIDSQEFYPFIEED